MKEAVRYLKALLTEPEHFESLLELTKRPLAAYVYVISPSLIYHLYTSSPSFNANALGLLAPEQELCFIAQHIHSPTARNLDRVFSTGGNYPTRLHTLPTPKE
ncbi:hypothetical protein PTRG_11736 [Pyrenophora tritici-repentis Pt-1C-BFP]|uniref:Uncharacterized protein n=1 Tax=Pyrenophora tritici-repentis (strain Pt-1C-BFP) TaxID=426418 RepID=B2WP26_PYRTR|nr:uncharacterized protein PTRG_11736 [Pyrenophora tritici-repentis Pt-1C-BFP]EDU44786.1 hypothetical protein PTRG_11736 [Pyrenophora tritici-repentis Pt-1C-BFP]